MSDILQGEGLVGLTEVEAAARRLAGVAVRTPLLPSDIVSEVTGANVRLKCESLQRAGSFKIRGAYNFVSQLSDEQVASGIITYSSGNHAQAVALSGKLRGVRAVVVMPTTAPKVKRDGAERLGAEVIYEGTTSLERRAKAEEIAEEQGLVIVPPFDHRHIIAGQGTVGLEIAREWPDVDLVLAPIGGGGLASGVAASIKRLLPTARERPVVIKQIDTIADGLAPVMAGELTYEHAFSLMDDVVTVSDDAIQEATSLLVSKQKLIVEFSGAAATAALISKAVEAQDARVAIVISGGNLDPTLVAGVA